MADVNSDEARTDVRDVRVNYDGRIFQPVLAPAAPAGDASGVPVQPTAGGDVDEGTRFQYHQQGNVVWATYSGGRVRFGTLVATLKSDGALDARYQHVASDGTIKSGRCRSTPEFLSDGRLRIHEEWAWTEGDAGSGSSIVEEL